MFVFAVSGRDREWGFVGKVLMGNLFCSHPQPICFFSCTIDYILYSILLILACVCVPGSGHSFFSLKANTPITIETLEFDVNTHRNNHQGGFGVVEQQQLPMDYSVQVYTVPGTNYRSILNTPDAWTLVADTTAIPVPEGGVLIPAHAFANIPLGGLTSSNTQSLYIAMNAPYIDSRSYALDKTGEVDSTAAAEGTLGPLVLYTGAGAQTKFPAMLDTTIAPQFSGVVHYSTCDSRSATEDAVMQTTVDYMFNVQGAVPFGMADPLVPAVELYMDTALAEGVLVEYATEHNLQRVGPPYTLTSAKSETCSEHCYSTTITVLFEHASTLSTGDVLSVLYGGETFLEGFSQLVGTTLDRDVAYAGPTIFQTEFHLVLEGIPAHAKMNESQQAFFEESLRNFITENSEVDVYGLSTTEQTLQGTNVLSVTGSITGIDTTSSSTSTSEVLDSLFLQNSASFPRTVYFSVLRSSDMDGSDAMFYENISSISGSVEPIIEFEPAPPTASPTAAPKASVRESTGNLVEKGLDNLTQSAQSADGETWFLIGCIAAAVFVVGFIIVILARWHAQRRLRRAPAKEKEKKSIEEASFSTKSTEEEKNNSTRNRTESQRSNDSSLHRSYDSLHRSYDSMQYSASPRQPARESRQFHRSSSFGGVPQHAGMGATTRHGSFSGQFGERSNSLNLEGVAPAHYPARQPSLGHQNGWHANNVGQHPLVSPQRVLSRKQSFPRPEPASPGMAHRPLVRNQSFSGNGMNRNGSFHRPTSPSPRQFSGGFASPAGRFAQGNNQQATRFPVQRSSSMDLARGAPSPGRPVQQSLGRMLSLSNEQSNRLPVQRSSSMNVSRAAPSPSRSMKSTVPGTPGRHPSTSQDGTRSLGNNSRSFGYDGQAFARSPSFNQVKINDNNMRVQSHAGIAQPSTPKPSSFNGPSNTRSRSDSFGSSSAGLQQRSASQAPFQRSSSMNSGSIASPRMPQTRPVRTPSGNGSVSRAMTPQRYHHSSRMLSHSLANRTNPVSRGPVQRSSSMTMASKHPCSPMKRGNPSPVADQNMSWARPAAPPAPARRLSSEKHKEARPQSIELMSNTSTSNKIPKARGVSSLHQSDSSLHFDPAWQARKPLASPIQRKPTKVGAKSPKQTIGGEAFSPQSRRPSVAMKPNVIRRSSSLESDGPQTPHDKSVSNSMRNPRSSSIGVRAESPRRIAQPMQPQVPSPRQPVRKATISAKTKKQHSATFDKPIHQSMSPR